MNLPTLTQVERIVTAAIVLIGAYFAFIKWAKERSVGKTAIKELKERVEKLEKGLAIADKEREKLFKEVEELENKLDTLIVNIIKKL